MDQPERGRGTQEKIMKVEVGGIERVTQTAAEAEVANFARQPLQGLPVAFALSWPQRHPQPFATFRVNHLNISMQALAIEFTRTENLHRAHIHIGRGKYA